MTWIPEDADTEEAAAITAALSAYLQEQRGDEEEPETWTGSRWTFAGRAKGLTGRDVRVPDAAPTDGWTALGRAERL
ncbi:acc operon protein [Natronomonas sp. EA1]|uniref:acc operon protein n=1 Tax=Natronomonas sp. EA1 TaxID=3421655 RepID=UPI003EB956B1